MRDNHIYASYAIVPPQIDRSKPAHQQSDPTLYAGVVKERDDGIVISGAQQLATGGPLSDYIHLACIHPLQLGDENYASQILLESVAEKTGFPAEMLELDMRLDDDLGIDSIKRVEILSALQERLPETRSIGPEQTAALRTLREIAEFVTAPTRAIPTVENGRGVSSPSLNGTDHHVKPRVRAPPPGAEGPCPLDSPERRETVKLAPGGEIWISEDGSPLAEALRLRLSRQGFRRESSLVMIRGGREPGEGFCGLIVLAPSGPCDAAFIAGAFRTIRAAGPALLRAGQRSGGALLTVSRLDGRFGVEGLWPERDPTSGALAGLAKTAALEWPGVNCKALDIGDGIDPDERTAGWIVEELFGAGRPRPGST